MGTGLLIDGEPTLSRVYSAKLEQLLGPVRERDEPVTSFHERSLRRPPTVSRRRRPGASPTRQAKRPCPRRSSCGTDAGSS